jgi:hypothetical protein
MVASATSPGRPLPFALHPNGKLVMPYTAGLRRFRAFRPTGD